MTFAWFKRIKPWQLGTGTGLLSLGVFLGGWFKCGETIVELALAVVISLAVGSAVFGLQRGKLYCWLAVFGLGALLALQSATELLLEVPFERQCFVALATALFWLVLATVFGALAEFVRLLHTLSHRVAEGIDERLDDWRDQEKEQEENQPNDQT